MSIKCQNYTRPELDKLHKLAINLEMPVGMYHVIVADNFIHGHFNYLSIFHLMMTVLQLKHVQFVVQISLLMCVAINLDRALYIQYPSHTTALTMTREGI